MALGGRRGAALAVVLGLSGLAPTLARGEVCASDPQTWSEALTAQLPLFLNLALSRSRSEFQVVLVGQPQVEPLAAKELADSPAASTAQGFCLYFTTLERRLVLLGSRRSRTTL